jgi:hypothetical protein
MKKASYYYKQWLIQAILGLILIGMGVSVSIEAGFAKFSDQPWIGLGTLGLVILNSGISFFGNAILHRSRYERLKD